MRQLPEAVPTLEVEPRDTQENVWEVVDQP